MAPMMGKGEVAAWFALLAAALLLATRRYPQPRVRTGVAALVALVWTVPLFLASSDLQVPLWLVSAALMSASAILLPSTPRQSYALAATLGAVHAASFWETGEGALGGIVLLYAAATIVGAALNARTHRHARHAAAMMREKEQVVSLLLREFEEGDADWLWQVDTAHRVRSPSPRFAFALAREEPRSIEDQPLIALLAGGAGASIHPSLQDLSERLLRCEPFSGLPVQVTVNDRQRWWELSGSPRSDAQGEFAGFHGVASDITAERESSDKIAYLARYDTLTGLPNRSMLTEDLARARS